MCIRDRCLAVSCAATLHIYFLGALAPWQNFARCKIHFTSKSCVLLYLQHYCTALQQRASAKLCGVVQGMELQNFCRGRHLYSAGQPSRWASAHILVIVYFSVFFLSLVECNRLSWQRFIFFSRTINILSRIVYTDTSIHLTSTHALLSLPTLCYGRQL